MGERPEDPDQAPIETPSPTCSSCDAAARWSVLVAVARPSDAPTVRSELACDDHVSRSLARRHATSVVALPIDREGRVDDERSAEVLVDGSVDDVLAVVAAHASPTATWVTDTWGQALYVDASWLTLTGQQHEEAMGRGWLRAFADDDADRLASLFERAVQARSTRSFALEFVIHPASERRRWIELRGRPLRARGARTVTWVLTASDITMLRTSLERLADRATHDALTGALNRVEIFEQVQHALVRLDRRRSAMAALFVDFDDFKDVNDRWGHEVGDQVLQALAKRLRASVRIGDLLGRYGGDEFVVVCEELRDRVQAIDIGERIVRDASTPIVVGDAQIEVTASVGIALARRPTEESPESLIGRADQAMYLAKQHRNAVVLAPDALSHHAM